MSIEARLSDDAKAVLEYFCTPNPERDFARAALTTAQAEIERLRGELAAALGITLTESRPVNAMS